MECLPVVLLTGIIPAIPSGAQRDEGACIDFALLSLTINNEHNGFPLRSINTREEFA